MNCVQKTMISGSHRAGCLEKTADCCLMAPAFFWRWKNVRVIEDQELAVRYSSCTCLPPVSCDCGGGGGGAACGAIIVGGCVLGIGAASIYGLISAAVSPFLGIGGALKHMAFALDEEAESYNDLACKHLEELGDMSQIDESLREGCCYFIQENSLKLKKNPDDLQKLSNDFLFKISNTEIDSFI